MQFPFSAFSPDQGDLSPGSLNQCDGVQPLAPGNGFGPFPMLSVSGTATAPSGGAPRGILSGQKKDGTYYVALATATTIELKQSDDTWSTVDSGLSITQGDDRCLLQFGTKLVSTDTTQGLRQYDLEAGGAASAISGVAPRWIFECGNMVFGLDCLDQTTGLRNNRLIRSTKFSDQTAWTGAGSDAQPLEGGGALICGGKLTDTSAIVLQQDAVKLIQVGDVGGGALWGLQSVSEKFGAVGAKSFVPFDGAAYWLATDGFRRFSLSGGIERIGAGRVDQWFLSRVDQTDLSLVQGGIDPYRKNILWRYKGPNATGTTVFGDIIGYNWAFDRWFTLTLQTTYLSYTATPGVTWDTMSGTWDASTATWDSRALQGGQPLFGAMDANYKYGNFAGQNMAATIETAVSDSPVSTLIARATPKDDSPDGTLQLGVRNSMSDATTWKTGNTKQTSGRVPLRGRGHYIAFRRNIPAGSTWTSAKGVDFVQSAAGGPR
jgi:hypothetical protein